MLNTDKIKAGAAALHAAMEVRTRDNGDSFVAFREGSPMIGRPRIVVALEGGLISAICAEGIDLSGVDVFVIDYDTDGADTEDLVEVAGVDAFVRGEEPGALHAEVSASLTEIAASWESAA